MTRAATGSMRPLWSCFIALAVRISCNLLGDAWRDWLGPCTRSQMAAQEYSR